MKTPYNALVVGCGSIGGAPALGSQGAVLTHAQAYRDHSDFVLGAVVDTDPARAKAAAEAWGAKAFISLQEALADQRYDIVSICVPTGKHLDVLREVLPLKPLVIILEKPLTPSLQSSQEMATVLRGVNIPVIVHYTRRFMPEFQQLQEKIKSGAFGEFLSGSVYYSKGILHNGSHAVDALRYLFGELRLGTVFSGRIEKDRTDPTLSLSLQIAGGGVVCLLAGDQRCASIFEMEFLFANRFVRVSEMDGGIRYFRVVPHPLGEGYTQWQEELSEPLRFEDELLSLLSHAGEVIRSGTACWCDAQDGLAAQKICEEAVVAFLGKGHG